MVSTRSFRRGRLSEQVVAEMEHLILEEYREPGQRLPKEAELAERFGVSRIVIREAVKILEDRGLVKARAGHGTVTAAPTPERVKASLLRLFQNQPIPTAVDMEHMLELRAVLEETAASLAAVRATPEDLALIAATLVEMEATHANVEETIEADLQFHRAVAKASHNHFFEMVIDPITQVFIQQLALSDSYSLGVQRHRRIYEAIAKGDPVAARQCVRRLIRSTREHTKQSLTLLTEEQAASE